MSHSLPDQLVVRQHERLQCRLRAHVRIDEEHAEQVAFARTVSDGTGTIGAHITDCSQGGLSLETSVFLPRGCRIRVRLDTAESTPHKLEVLARVQRSSMTNRAPTYVLGASFVGKGADHEAAVAALLDCSRQAMISQRAPNAPAKGAA